MMNEEREVCACSGHQSLPVGWDTWERDDPLAAVWSMVMFGGVCEWARHAVTWWGAGRGGTK